MFPPKNARGRNDQDYITARDTHT